MPISANALAIIEEQLSKGQAVMFGEWLGCEHRTGSFTGDKGGEAKHSDAITHAILCGAKAYNITQRIQTESKDQQAPTDPNLKRGVPVVIILTSMTWKEGTVKINCSAVMPINADVTPGATPPPRTRP